MHRRTCIATPYILSETKEEAVKDVDSQQRRRDSSIAGRRVPTNGTLEKAGRHFAQNDAERVAADLFDLDQVFAASHFLTFQGRNAGWQKGPESSRSGIAGTCHFRLDLARSRSAC